MKTNKFLNDPEQTTTRREKKQTVKEAAQDSSTAARNAGKGTRTAVKRTLTAGQKSTVSSQKSPAAGQKSAAADRQHDPASAEARPQTPTEACVQPLLYPNTELCIDLKLWTLEPRRLPVGKRLDGILEHTDETTFTFYQSPVQRSGSPMRISRMLIPGIYVNVRQRADGSYSVNLLRPLLTDRKSVAVFCNGAARELLSVAALLDTAERRTLRPDC